VAAAAREQTVIEWLLLLGWEVEVREESGVYLGSATRVVGETTIRVEAQSGSAESLAWWLVEAATVALERRLPARLGIAA
jgi:hypothetical protein